MFGVFKFKLIQSVSYNFDFLTDEDSECNYIKSINDDSDYYFVMIIKYIINYLNYLKLFNIFFIYQLCKYNLIDIIILYKFIYINVV